MQVAYNQRRGYWHFVLYLEPGISAGSALNGPQIIEPSSSRYAAEWLNNLEPCEPDALHVSLVGMNDAPRLWYPCVYEDPESPSAVAGEGCLCWQTFRDPVTQLPVAAEHYRTVSGNIETWRRYTYAPLELPEREQLERLIVDREAGMFWIRSTRGILYIMPEERGAGYEVGYGGGGPGEFARFIVKVVRSGGLDISAGTGDEDRNSLVDSWACSKSADKTRELSLGQLKHLCLEGTLP